MLICWVNLVKIYAKHYKFVIITSGFKRLNVPKEKWGPMRYNECILLPHIHLLSRLASLTQDQTAWDMFLSVHMGIGGLVTHPQVDKPAGNTPIPDGNLPLTTNHLN